MSRAIVSKKKASQLQGGENGKSIELENKSVTVDISQTSKETQSTGDTTTT